MPSEKQKYLQKEDISFPNTEKNRFYSKILMPKSEDGCMEWIGCINQCGYGHFRNINPITKKARSLLAHRFSYILNFGEIESDKVICHHCDNPKCVRPDHLFMATQIENIRDRDKKRRTSMGITRSNCKLTEKQVLEIRADTIHSNKELQKLYNVSSGIISSIKSRRIWRHI